MHEDITQLADKVQYYFDRQGLDTELREDAVEMRADIAEEFELVQDDTGYRVFVRQQMQQAREEFRDPDGDRDTPLCRCSLPTHACPIKQAQLPGLVRQADDFRDAKHRFSERHPQEVVLTEADREWIEIKGQVRQTLREIKQKLLDASEAGEPERELSEV
jgi:hypothetical protein